MEGNRLNHHAARKPKQGRRNLDNLANVGIVATSERENLREVVESLLSQAVRSRPLRVLDVGGGLNSWLGDLVTDILDIDFRSESVLNPQVADACNPSTWRIYEDNEFDFVSCTHTLCDLRDPALVVREMSRIGRAGFIAVPNRHSECSIHESLYYRGYGHHRYIYKVSANGAFEAFPKFPIVAFRSPVPRALYRWLPQRLKESRVQALFPQSPSWSWIDKGIANHQHELGILWRDTVNLRYYNADYTGRNISELSELAYKFVTAPTSEKVLEDGDMELLLKGLQRPSNKDGLL